MILKFVIMENVKNSVNALILKLVITQQKNVSLNVENVNQFFRDAEKLEIILCVCEYLYIIYGNFILGVYNFLFFMDYSVIVLFFWNE